jgi:hypothetical protein
VTNARKRIKPQLFEQIALQFKIPLLNDSPKIDACLGNGQGAFCKKAKSTASPPFFK